MKVSYSMYKYAPESATLKLNGVKFKVVNTLGDYLGLSYSDLLDFKKVLQAFRTKLKATDLRPYVSLRVDYPETQGINSYCFAHGRINHVRDIMVSIKQHHKHNGHLNPIYFIRFNNGEYRQFKL